MNVKSFNADIGYGHLTIQELLCEAAEISANDGSIEINSGEAGSLNIDNAYGTVNMKDIICTNLNLTSTDGSIKLDGLSVGNADIENTYGNITLRLQEKKQNTPLI